MNNIIRMWNQNRKKIIVIVLVVVFCFLIIQALNQRAKNQLKNRNLNEETISKEEQEKIKNLPTTSIITGEKVKEETTKTNVNVIETFSNACNNGDIEEAYNLLTDECKSTLFPTLENFIQNYYNIIFNQKRTIKIENYKNSSTANTYLVTFYEDINSISSIGQVNQYKDYITVKPKENKINVNSFIESKEIESKTDNEGIEIAVLKQEIYIDYEIYKIEVKNNTENTVLLDTRKTSKTIYISDNKNIKYTAYANELANSIFELQQNSSKIFEIKFNKKYNSADKTKKVVFSDIVKNYEEYSKNDTEDRLKIEVSL